MIKKIQLNIEGMHCDSCAIGIQMVLENTDGVKKSLVYYDKKIAEVEFDEDKVPVENLLKAVSELGYKASVKED